MQGVKRDNLRFKTVAQSKAIKDADLLQYDLIESRLTSKPSMKGIALSSSSIEEYEKFRVNRMYEEDEVFVDFIPPKG